MIDNLVKKGKKAKMNISQVPMRHPTPPHLNHKSMGWTSHFSLMMWHPQRASPQDMSVRCPAWLCELQRCLLLSIMPVARHHVECQLQNFQQKCHITGSIKLLFDNTGFLIVQDTHSLKSPSIYTHSAVTVYQLSCLTTLSHAFSRNSKTLYLMLFGKVE